MEHDAWDDPMCEVWVRELDETLRAVAGRRGPKVLIAHSLGCTLVMRWAAQRQDEAVVAAFLVGVPNVHGPDFPTEARGFDTLKLPQLPFTTLVVASENDPYGSLEHSTEVAQAIGADLVNAAARGHNNSSSGLGDWPEGWNLYSALLGTLPG